MPGTLEHRWALAGISLFAYSVAFAAAPLDTAIQTHVETQEQGARSQDQVEKLDDGTQALVIEYRNGLREIEALKTYHQQLGREVKSQETERVSVDKQLADIEVTQRDILPLMLRMLELVVQFVTLDTPFLEQERTKRLDDLKAMMDRSDMTLAEKYRRLMEAYQIETEYGRTIEAYRGDLKSGDKSRAVDFLRFGRVGLYYLTLDRRGGNTWTMWANTSAMFSEVGPVHPVPPGETTFEHDLHPRFDRETLSQILLELCQRVSGDLVRQRYLAKTVGIKLRYADFHTLTRDITLEAPTADVETIRSAARACLRRVPLDRRLRLLGLRVTSLVRSGGDKDTTDPVSVPDDHTARESLRLLD